MILDISFLYVEGRVYDIGARRVSIYNLDFGTFPRVGEEGAFPICMTRRLGGNGESFHWMLGSTGWVALLSYDSTFSPLLFSWLALPISRSDQFTTRHEFPLVE
jgi:hypothetical protein